LCNEIRISTEKFDHKPAIKTLFLGGGTPSLLPVDLLVQVYQVCSDSFLILPEAEITIEANPGTITQENLQALRHFGYNRISFGMQSAHPVDLVLLERIHDTVDVIHSVSWARKAGFKNISLDLIFGVPGQSFDRWKKTLDTALAMQPEHLSLYALIIEHGTPFLRWVQRGLVTTPDDDLAADMYEWACVRLDEAGYVHYEISNWALNGSDGDFSCQHNLQYWRNQPYFGFGAGAHGFINRVRTRNVRGVKTYIERISNNANAPFPPGAAGETGQVSRPLD
jgi:oxygen-independent coproporphyrinogen III oxidase